MQRACAILYCHLWSVRLYQIFPRYLTIGTIFKKALLKIKRVFRFSLRLSETFLIRRGIFFSSNATTCSYELSWFPSWLWR